MADDLAGAFGQAWQIIRQELKAVTDQIQQARAGGEEPSRAALRRRGDLDRFEIATRIELSRFTLQAEQRINRELPAAGIAGAENGATLATVALGAPPTLSVATAPLPVVAAAQIGLPVSRVARLLEDLPELTAQGVRETLMRGIVLGKNPRDVAKLVREHLGGTLARSLTIARTEMLTAYREGARQTYEANPRVIRGWTWHSALDRRTCPVCWAMHGTTHRVDESLASHPSCRCVMLPLTYSWAQLGFAGLKETAWTPMPGSQIFARLERVDQLTVLGPGKLALYESGEIRLEDLVVRTRSRFGPGRAEVPLRELRQRRAA